MTYIRVMRRLLLLWVALLPATALGDGKVFSPEAVRDPPAIADQQALICWSEGIERLVIQTSFSGTGTNFAWVVPLPAKPKIEVAPSGLFPTLHYLFEPELVDTMPRIYLGVLFVLGLIGLAYELKPRKRPTLKVFIMAATVSACAWAIGPEVGPFVTVAVIVGIVLLWLQAEPVYVAILVVLLGFVLGSILMPSLARSKGSAAPHETPSVSILDRSRVGAYDTVTLGANAPGELAHWLETNGFVFSSNALPVLSDYTKREWVFVAAKLARTNAAAGTETIHPLSFTFKSPKAVYPMRLTGVDGGPLFVDLYLFGPGSATAEGFSVRHSSRPLFPDQPKSWTVRKPKDLQIFHPVLRDWVNDSLVGTRLHGELGKAQQTNDIVVKWTPFRKKVARQFSQRGAIVYSANIASGVLAAGVLLLCILRLSSMYSRIMPFLLAVGVVGIALGTYASLEKVSVHYVKRYPVQNNLMHLASFVNSGDVLEAREELDYYLTQVPKLKPLHENTLLGGRVHEEDSPGNFILRVTNSSLEFVAYDAAAAPHVLRTEKIVEEQETPNQAAASHGSQKRR